MAAESRKWIFTIASSARLTKNKHLSVGDTRHSEITISLTKGNGHRFARHKHIRASGQRSANDLGRTNSRRNKAGAQYCFSCTSICRFVFSTISICLANNTFNLFYPFCSSLHSCTRTLPRQCCHSMEGQFFCCPHSLRRKIRGVSRFGTIGSGHIVFLEILWCTHFTSRKTFFDVVLYSSSALRRICEVASRSNFPVLLWLSYPFLCTYDPVVKYSSFLTLPNSNKNPATWRWRDF